MESQLNVIWKKLTDFENYINWNPFIKSISGKKQVGEHLTAFIQPPEGKGMTFKPKILVYQNSKEFRWLGKLLIRGLFDGEHYFILEELENNQTRFIQGEKFSGILIHFMGRVLKCTKKGFELMNMAIKEEVELETS